jgi:hypothetical protein
MWVNMWVVLWKLMEVRAPLGHTQIGPISHTLAQSRRRFAWAEVIHKVFLFCRTVIAALTARRRLCLLALCCSVGAAERQCALDCGRRGWLTGSSTSIGQLAPSAITMIGDLVSCIQHRKTSSGG